MSVSRQAICRVLHIAAASVSLLLGCGTARADDVSVAVAANFTGAVRELAARFEQRTGHRAQVSIGSTGKLYAQIRHGAPFEVFLAADDETPAKLIAESAAVGDSRFTYAVGRLVLWSASPDVVDDQGAVLKTGSFRHLAIANPKLAPYGVAAVQAMRSLGVQEQLAPRLVKAESISQAYQYVVSGNAELGFIALSQVMQQGRLSAGSGWIVPESLHTPLRQDAVLLNAGRGKPAALAWLEWLKSDEAAAIIRAHGYTLPQAGAR